MSGLNYDLIIGALLFAKCTGNLPIWYIKVLVVAYKEESLI